MKCDNCSKCCQNLFIESLYEITDDIKEWLELHNLEVKEIKGRKYIKINNPCSKLKDGKCSIYEDRPNVCRDYNCENNKEFIC